MVSSVLELILFSIPSLVYERVLRAKGRTAQQARSAVGWRIGDLRMYALAIVMSAVLLPLTYLALRGISQGSLDTSSRLHVTYGSASTPSGYASLALLALAEEILFRGLLAGILIRRLGFAVGNTLQALMFLAPHLLLLLVSVRLWPLLPVQLISGWLLGWLRDRSASVGPCAVAHILANVLAPVLIAA